MNYVKQRRSRPKLDRRNANNHINYEAPDSPSSTSSFEDSTSSLHRRLRSLEGHSGRTSFRVEGIDGEFDLICRSLGLSGPEDFSIPLAAWEASKVSSPLSSARLRDKFEVANSVENDRLDEDWEDRKDSSPLANFTSSRFRDEFDSERLSNSFTARVTVRDEELRNLDVDVVGFDNGNRLQNGIIGFRPSKLAPPPVALQSHIDCGRSTWDLLRDFGPEVIGGSSEDSPSEGTPSGEGDGRVMDKHVAIEVEVEVEVEGSRDVGFEPCSSSSNDDEDDADDDNAASLLVESLHSVSPSARSRRRFNSWQQGVYLGSGSFGTVYEAFTDDGEFFAVKEVSLLDQGSQGRQSILQLEQEISLLSRFQHENIVRYFGTERDDKKLYIFLELVTKGSLSSLYEKFNLRDSQVSVYTRQILSGLNYLHQQNVVHRDIKCANILVHVSGSVKLADFGLAKVSTLDNIKSCKGTAFWMAPEVVSGKTSGYGPAADIWSLGCTVLEMLTRRIPYSHLEGFQAMFRIGRGEPPPIPNSLSRDAQDFILKCLQVNPVDRPTAAQLLDHPFVKKPSSTFPSPASPRV